MSQENVEFFEKEINKVIDYFRVKYSMSYDEVVVTLFIVINTLMNEEKE